ncbi:MAG TPA: carboxylating nicotinate-nucleotide diphosphorylase [Cyanobacteria bacterium UBA11991]|nr:carboxylating nicotinate-nucleotide diphosphorylase [Cyanobacteriota bacterium]MDY6363952.1 carboxylating nicotinate-nucleotide diphosphorylase [Cyanobacteriota bacterium]HCB11341.1 carboxylating nicotinate-nucleotide diphosphorylase [Cyanobacteria bacterium UBA11991]
MLSNFYVEQHVKNALQEDIGFGDVTTESILTENNIFNAKLTSRVDGIVCGLEVFKTVFKVLSDSVEVNLLFKDGDEIKKGDVLATLKGPGKYLLLGERVSLNYIQRMSGIATETHKYQQAIGDLPCKIVDTRKTTPNFRAFEKYAVKCGGGALHRFNLSDCAMIKDNHIKVAGSVTNAVKMVKANLSHAHKLELECDTLEQVKEALPLGVDIIMLDNMSLDEMKEGVKLINHKAIVEASGNVKLNNIRQIAECGVDIISSSAIVANAPALDLGLDM